jgi:hypothetical protein
MFEMFEIKTALMRPRRHEEILATTGFLQDLGENLTQPGKGSVAILAAVAVEGATQRGPVYDGEQILGVMVCAAKDGVRVNQVVVDHNIPRGIAINVAAMFATRALQLEFATTGIAPNEAREMEMFNTIGEMAELPELTSPNA